MPLPRMLARSLLPTCAALALVLACANACVKLGKSNTATEDGAKPETARDDRSDQPGPRDQGSHEQPAVDVVALDPGDARPCERMCGRIGDCLQTEEGSDPADATGIEFACLDTCVYADPEQPAASAFQDCEKASACGELLGCARGRWDAAIAARRPVEIPTEFAAVRDTCESTCMAMFSCSYWYRMPSQLDPGMATSDFYNSVDICTDSCRNGDQSYVAYSNCVDDTDCGQFYNCPARSFP
ncbi:hypothetical protein ACNOYE_04355 [Nannocystaceae bacterium ST9]